MPLLRHQYTPLLMVIDPRGLPIRNVAYHCQNAAGDRAERIHRQVFNASGQMIQQWDPRLLELSEHEPGVQPNQATLHSLSGQALYTQSVDAGWRVICNDAAGLLREDWDGRETHHWYEYDAQMRPVSVVLAPDHCVERFTYAGSSEEEARHNRCGQMIRCDDPAGSLWQETFGLSGQPLAETRRFCASLAAANWPESEADLEARAYTTQWRYDAVGAVVEHIDVLEHVQRFEVDVAGQSHASFLDGVTLLKNMQYNAFGQGEFEQAGNEVVTTMQYSPMDGLLLELKTVTSDGKTLQDMHYQYDPVGNILRIEDLAQPVQWHAQQRIQAVSTYTYDSLYQLISATGRETASQIIGPGLPQVETFGAKDDSRRRNYTQTYTYDKGGNLTRLKHDAGSGSTYSREMTVDTCSNRSLFKDGSPIDFAKGFDANGNQRHLSPGQTMQWDVRNQLHQVTQVQREEPEGQDDDVEVYVYDGKGQRVRKIRRAKTRSGQHLNEVRYFPGLEIRTGSSGEELHVVIAQAGRNSVRLLHWCSGKPSTIKNDQLRYSLSDHLGSSSLELDQNAEVITHESYYPYGGTAWWAAKNAVDAKYKTIRYSGKERDATGLYYYGFRYYAPWLQRWINPDPAGDVDGLNRYRFVRNNPLSYTDPNGLDPDGEDSEKKAFVADLLKMHFKQYVLPQIKARRETDKAGAIKRLDRIVGPKTSGEVVEGLATWIQAASLTINMPTDSLAGIKGDSYGNTWETKFRSNRTYLEKRDHIERELFSYESSPVDIVKRIGSNVGARTFMPQFRPVYGAVDFNQRFRVSEKRIAIGGAPQYGDAVLTLSNAQKTHETLTYTASDSYKSFTKPNVLGLPPLNSLSDMLANLDNPYPVVLYMPTKNLEKMAHSLNFNSMLNPAKTEYTEWQSHGVLKWSEFKDVAIKRGHNDKPAVKRFAKKHSVNYRVLDKR